MSGDDISDTLRSTLSPLLLGELQRLSEDGADGSLLDYLLLLVTSGRTQDSIVTDLVEFFGEEKAQILGAFIGKLHKQYVQQTKQPQPSPAPVQPNTQSPQPKAIGPKRPREDNTTIQENSGKKETPSKDSSREESSRRSNGTSSSSSQSQSSSSSRTKPDQPRFVPGATKLSRSQQSPPGPTSVPEVVVAGGRASQRGRAALASVVVVSRKQEPIEQLEESVEPAPKRQKQQIVRRSGNEEQQEESNQPRFQITFRGADALTPQAAAATAKPKRLLITKGGKEVIVSPTNQAEASEKATKKLVKRGEAAKEILQATVGKKGQQQTKQPQQPAKRQFGGGFPGGEDAQMQQDYHEEEQEQEPDQEEEQPAPAPVQVPVRKAPVVVAARKAMPQVVPQQQQQQQDQEESYDEGGMEDTAPSAFKSAGAPAFQSQTKCRFFPACTNVQCPYLHPTKLCAAFPNCVLGDACLDLHPALPCRYGEGCTNPVCSYTHPASFSSGRGGRGGAVRGRGGRGALRGGLGRGGASTLDSGVSGTVPPTSSTRGMVSRVGSNRGGRGGLTNMLKMANTPCRYADGCTREDCIYSHPGKSNSNGGGNSVGNSTLDLSAPFSANNGAAPQQSAFTQGYQPKSAEEVAAMFRAKVQQQ